MFSKLWDARTGRILFTALTFLLVLAFLYGARETITLYLFAIFFAYLVDPVVFRLQKPLRGRGIAILAFYILFLGVLVGLGFLLGPRVAEEGRSLIRSLPTLLDRMASGQFVVALAHNEGWDQASQHHIQQFFMNHRNEILNYAEGIAGGLRAPLYHIWWLILIPILSIFFLTTGSHIVEGIVNLRRDGHESTELKRTIADIHSMLGKYIRAQLILACLTAIAFTLVLWLMRVPYSFGVEPTGRNMRVHSSCRPCCCLYSRLRNCRHLRLQPHGVALFISWILESDSGLRERSAHHGKVGPDISVSRDLLCACRWRDCGSARCNGRGPPSRHPAYCLAGSRERLAGNTFCMTAALPQHPAGDLMLKGFRRLRPEPLRAASQCVRCDDFPFCLRAS